MSIIISDLSYRYPNQLPLFEHLNLSVGTNRKISVIGNNGCGKSTLLKLIAGGLSLQQGSIQLASTPYVVPQQTIDTNRTIAQVLAVSSKLEALKAITNGSMDESHFEILGDDWDIESRCISAFTYWSIPHLDLSTPLNQLSGGEKTKVYLAGMMINAPDIVLLDEPTNHLDSTSRELLYDYLSQIKSTCVVVSHDTTLLDQFDITCELSAKGIKRYGGNYTFYKEQKTLEIEALNENIETEERMLRLARKKIQKEKEKQDKRNSQGEKNKKELPRIARKTALNRGEQTGARLKEVHSQLIHENEERLKKLRNEQQIYAELKIDLSDSNLHKGKLLVKAEQINHSYSGDNLLWIESLDLSLYSGTRCLVKGKNGSGKTTLVNILTGGLCPSQGQISIGDFTYAYLDQEYNLVHKNCTILELAESNNQRNLPMHELRMLLNRSLFTAESLAKNCLELSGGEKMRLSILMLILRKQAPDLLILDEPTNNIDLASIHILTQTIKSFKGSLLVISHDREFIEEIGINMEIEL